ncbi:hypothetical protein BU17DRAFT_68529 [Hysterangium stoloniferum]|nr:hypothetical protein BU17DRAFT_68529 [Hysterangium stoloniferum]
MVVKMTGMPTNTTSNPETALMSNHPWSPQIIKTGMSEISWGKLPEHWNCTETEHDLCYPAPDGNQHIPPSANAKAKRATMTHPLLSGCRRGPPTSDHREGVEEQPPLVSSCSRVPDDEKHIPDGHQPISLSANDAEVRIDEMMPEKSINTTSNLREDIEELPPLESSYQVPNNDQDILSANHVEVLADKFKPCQGKTSYHDPPTVVTMPGCPPTPCPAEALRSNHP